MFSLDIDTVRITEFWYRPNITNHETLTNDLFVWASSSY